MFVMSKAEAERARKLLGIEPASGDSTDDSNPGRATASGGSGGAVARLFLYAGASGAARNRYRALAVIAIALPAGLSLVTREPVLMALVPVALIILWQKLRLMSFARAKGFESDYTAFLLSLASAIRTGKDPLGAFMSSAELFNERSVLRLEIERVKADIETGRPEDSAMRKFAASIEHPDVGLFCTAFILARRQGSSLAECLQRLVRVTRQRQSFRRKTRASVAMQRLSSFGIAGCTVAIGGIQAAMNPKGLIETLHHPLGVKAVCLGLGLIVIGIGWMLKMTSSRV